MIAILLNILIALIVLSIVYWIVTMLPLPAPTKPIALAVLGLILLIWILGVTGIFGHSWLVRF